MVWAFAHIAQMVEHFLGKEEVTGSIPVVGSIVFSFRDFLKFKKVAVKIN